MTQVLKGGRKGQKRRSAGRVRRTQCPIAGSKMKEYARIKERPLGAQDNPQMTVSRKWRALLGTEFYQYLNEQGNRFSLRASGKECSPTKP